MSERQLLPSGPFTRQQADAITSRYQNIAIEDVRPSHFRLVVRDSEGRMVWRAWSFEPDAGEGLNCYIRQLSPQGILLRLTIAIHHPCISFIPHTPAIVAGVFIDGEYP
ncbi:DUF905 domain-containing protein [Enterobacteriaceae bacterium Kacie_13]|nr:DUF905 domain-containing protein [Enterobacteriaceae bacterium Kacie_13]